MRTNHRQFKRNT